MVVLCNEANIWIDNMKYVSVLTKSTRMLSTYYIIYCTGWSQSTKQASRRARSVRRVWGGGDWIRVDRHPCWSFQNWRRPPRRAGETQGPRGFVHRQDYSYSCNYYQDRGGEDEYIVTSTLVTIKTAKSTFVDTKLLIIQIFWYKNDVWWNLYPSLEHNANARLRAGNCIDTYCSSKNSEHL